MKFRTILSLATFFLTCFTIAVFAQPQPNADAKRAAENQSVTGKITSVGDAAFALSVAKENQNVESVEFLVDDKTKVEGKLAVGTEAMVEYRSEGGRNIAIRVVVKQSSAIRPH